MVKICVSVTLVGLLLCCKSTVHSHESKSHVGLMVNEVIINPYDSSILMLDITLQNLSDTSFFIENGAMYNAVFSHELDLKNKATIILNESNFKDRLPLREIQDNFPAILFTDSAYKLKQFSNNFLESNKKKEKEINGKIFYVLNAQQNLNLKIELVIEPYEFLKIKESLTLKNVKLALKLQALRGNSNKTFPLIIVSENSRKLGEVIMKLL